MVIAGNSARREDTEIFKKRFLKSFRDENYRKGVRKPSEIYRELILDSGILNTETRVRSVNTQNLGIGEGMSQNWRYYTINPKLFFSE